MKSIRLIAIMAGLCFLALNLEAQYTTGFLTNGLIAWYPLNGSAIDATGNGNDGLLGSSVTFVQDRFGNSNGAAAFSGDSGSYIALNTTNLNLESNLTVSVWVNFTTAYGNNGPRIFSSGYEMTLNAPNNDYTLSNRFVAFAGSGSTSAIVYAGQWTHIVGVICNTTNIIYINGTLAASGSLTEPILYTLTNAAIGSSAVIYGFDSFGGALADLRIYNRSLSAQEVSALYESFASGIITVPTITISGNTNLAYSIQYVTNLSLTNWTTLVSNIVLQGSTPYYYPDTNSIVQPQRFYRVVTQ